jgi:hypothetical protein
MAAKVSEIAAGIATRLATISGLRTVTFQPDQLNPPVAFPVLDEITYHGAFGGGDVETEWTVTAVTGRWTERTSYAALDAYLDFSGSSSLRAALEADATLGGVVSTSVVASGTKVVSIVQGEAEFLAVEFSLRCFS